MLHRPLLRRDDLMHDTPEKRVPRDEALIVRSAREHLERLFHVLSIKLSPQLNLLHRHRRDVGELRERRAAHAADARVDQGRVRAAAGGEGRARVERPRG